jgi:exodeoxyribonuclease VII small subunit
VFNPARFWYTLKTLPEGLTNAMGFSGDMERLQEIIDEFEKNDPDMESSLALFEEGVKLIKGCREYLKNAKRKVTALSSDGETEEDFDDGTQPG